MSTASNAFLVALVLAAAEDSDGLDRLACPARVHRGYSPRRRRPRSAPARQSRISGRNPDQPARTL